MSDADYNSGAEAMRRAAIALCQAHRPNAEVSRFMSIGLREEIRAEERGERIAAEVLERAIAALQLPMGNG